MPNIPLELNTNENFSSELCIGIVNQNTKRQCSRKGKKEFGNLCGLHHNKQLKHGIIDTIENTAKKSTKSFVLKKKIIPFSLIIFVVILMRIVLIKVYVITILYIEG